MTITVGITVEYLKALEIALDILSVESRVEDRSLTPEEVQRKHVIIINKPLF